MKNLAGAKGCDVDIRKELVEAGVEIEAHSQPIQGEVPTILTGKLGSFTFKRAWYYWVVTGYVPLEVAKEMYGDPMIGQRDVRVVGHCGCPPPEAWAFPKEEDLHDLLVQKGMTSISYGELAAKFNSGELQGPRYVSHYHIDSQEGLNLFVATITKHGLV